MNKYRVRPSQKVDLDGYDPDDTRLLPDGNQEAEEKTPRFRSASPSIRSCSFPVTKEVWKRRYEPILGFEEMLVEEGCVLLKRLQGRLDDSQKRWKFQLGDVEERKMWGEYPRAYEAALSRGGALADSPDLDRDPVPGVVGVALHVPGRRNRFRLGVPGGVGRADHQGVTPGRE
jgi:Polyphosphate kinase 2 (PPK2)